jgi:GntR family transcriptional regulator
MGKLQTEQITADQELAEHLNLQAGTELTRVARIIYTDDRPIAYLVDTLPIDILSTGELQSDFTGSVLDLLLGRGAPKLIQSKTDIKAIGATPEVARALQIQRDDVLLLLSAQLFTEDSRVIDFSISYFLPGYFRFHVVRRVGNHVP